jgi:hypothetical protein
VLETAGGVRFTAVGAGSSVMRNRSNSLELFSMTWKSLSVSVDVQIRRLSWSGWGAGEATSFGCDSLLPISRVITLKL